MKKIKIITFLIFSIVSGCMMLTTNKYQIIGKGWDNYNGKEFRIAVRDTSVSGMDIVGKATITKGEFLIEGKIKHPQTAFLGIYTPEGEFAGWKQDFIIEPGKILLEFKPEAKKAAVNGGKYYDIILENVLNSSEVKFAAKNLGAFSEKFYALSEEEQNEAALKEFMDLYNKHSKAKEIAYRELHANHEDPYVRLLALSKIPRLKNFEKELIQLEAELGTVPEIIAAKYRIKQTEERVKNKQNFGVGNVVKNFAAKNLNGKSFSLSDVLKENKYVLIEFWASWCGPCRAEIPHMKKAYSDFEKKGFEIVSFTLDHLEKSWQKASGEEQIPWINVGDLKAYKSPVVQMYGVEGIPANFLVNKEGRIIAINLRGETLDRKLGELLK